MTLTQAVEGKLASHLHPEPSYSLADHPMPTGREEIWRFTPLARLSTLLEELPASLTAGGQLEWQITQREGAQMRLVSDEEARSFGEVAPSDRPSALAVEAFKDAGQGAWLLEIADDAQIDEPIVVSLHGNSDAEPIRARMMVKVGRHAKATIVVRHTGSAQFNAINTVVVGDGSQIEFVTLQLWDDNAVHLGRDAIRVGRDARVRHIAVTFGGDVVRLNTTVTYDGPGGDAELLGLYFADAGQHLEHRLFVDHNQPKTRSNVDYRGALQGKGAHSVWVGDVLIRREAEGIETYESNKNLVLTEGCRADSVPNLEIETGEIEGAGHASTTGRFDDEQLFYLQSRGVPEDEARRLVVHGFFHEIIRKIGVSEIEERLEALVEDELAKNQIGI